MQDFLRYNRHNHQPNPFKQNSNAFGGSTADLVQLVGNLFNVVGDSLGVIGQVMAIKEAEQQDQAVQQQFQDLKQQIEQQQQQIQQLLENNKTSKVNKASNNPSRIQCK